MIRWYGWALTIEDALLKFNYSKLELSQFNPRNRYISFQNAKALIPKLSNLDIYDAEKYLINAIERKKIYAFHFYVGLVKPELSIDGERWRNGYFAKWQLNRLLSTELGEQKEKINKLVKIESDAEPIEPLTNEQTEPQPSPCFAQFKKLRANEIGLVIMENRTAKMVIKGRTITVNPDELGLKTDTQSWKLLEKSALSHGSLTSTLQMLYSTNNLVAEKGKIKAAISRLRNSLKKSMGLIDTPIHYTKGSGYKFTFKTMTHESLKDGNVSKGGDMMDYNNYESFDENQHGGNFWLEDE